MNNSTIPGSTDATGLFKPLCSYHCESLSNYTCFELPDASICKGCKQVEEYLKDKPPLFCYNENNELVKGIEGLEVKGPVFQQCMAFNDDMTPKDDAWQTCTEGEAIRDTLNGGETRRVYISVQPTEKADLPISKGSYTINIYNKPDNKTVDILQDSDKIVLTHKQAIELANEILSKKNHAKLN